MTRLIALFFFALFGATSVTCIANERFTPQQEVVAKLYAAYSWQPLFMQSVGTSIHHENLETLKKYFTPELAALIVADEKCAELEKGICVINFDILFNTQDPHIYSIAINSGKLETQVEVTFNEESKNDQYSVTCIVSKTAVGWRISDILYEKGFSLKSALTAK